MVCECGVHPEGSRASRLEGDWMEFRDQTLGFLV